MKKRVLLLFETWLFIRQRLNLSRLLPIFKTVSLLVALVAMPVTKIQMMFAQMMQELWWAPLAAV